MVNLLHFSCHNAFDTKDCHIMLKKTAVKPGDFAKDEASIVNAAAFIFMNACYSDKKVPKYTSIGGWANSFLNTGAGAFIGTLWEVRDKTASVFARALYEELLKNDKPFGEALRRARETAKAAAPADPTWLAYSFYGDGAARIGKPAS